MECILFLVFPEGFYSSYFELFNTQPFAHEVTESDDGSSEVKVSDRVPPARENDG